jgi:hypothetical protein
MNQTISIASASDRPLQFSGVIGQVQRVDLDSLVRSRIQASGDLHDVAACLRLLLSGGFSVWDDGRLLETRVLVDRIDRLKIVIHTREHGPPHFHVSAPGIDAAFSIGRCELLFGAVSGKERRLIKYWYEHARPLLIRTWNATRSADCPVGPIQE